jgi:NAD(P)-dependent dehydrogenase (short-subunit alcohol dehydrogenase family)
VVVVTGSSSGHGYLVAQHAARRGAHLVLAARSLDKLEAADTELRAMGAASVMVVRTDVTDEAQVNALVDRTVRRYGRVDVLINNAGMIGVGPVETMTLEDFREAMATNFWGAVYATLAALPHMRRQRFGRIGNVSSIGGKVAAPHLLPYTASKFALTGFTEGLRAELAKDNILVTGIYPATMRTGGHTHALFKGNREAEYTWFALSDTLPVLSLSADRVARKLWEAVCDGEAEVLVGWPTRLAVGLQALFPNETAEAAAIVNHFLPPPDPGAVQAVRGEDLDVKFALILNRAIPPSARPGLN